MQLVYQNSVLRDGQSLICILDEIQLSSLVAKLSFLLRQVSFARSLDEIFLIIINKLEQLFFNIGVMVGYFGLVEVGEFLFLNKF